MALPLAFAGMPLYMYMPDYYVREWGVSLSVAGVLLLVLRCVDAGQDLIIGHLCDRHSARRGQAMALGFLILVAGMAAILHGPPVAVIATAWFACAIALAALGLSVMSINMALIGGFWQAESRGRLRVAAWRESFTLAGMIIAVALPFILQWYMDEADSFFLLFWVFAGFAAAGAFFFRRFWVRHGEIFKRAGAAGGWDFFEGNRGFLVTCFLTHLAAALPAALFLFFVRDYMGLAEATGLFLLLYLGSGIAGMPLWQIFAARWGQARAWTISMVLAVAAFAATLFITPGNAVAFAAICVLSGMALGADLSIPPSMMAVRLAARGQEAQGSRAFAVMNMIPKLALGLASGGALLVLGQAGYEAGGAENTPQVLGLLVSLYAGVPCVMKLGAAFMLRQSEKRFKQGVNDEISERSVGDGRSYGA
jgi:Na+/melibiose symporter-like transporter